MMTKIKIAILTAFFAVLSYPMLGATIDGPETITAGRIAVFEADVEGDALIFPAEHVDLVKDSNKKNFYIATNVPGKYTLVFFAVEGGNPALSQKTFEVKALPSPSPSPSPEPEPKPEPEPEPDLTQVEKDAIIYALQSVCYSIEKGRLVSPAGVRASFKVAVKQKVVTETTALSRRLDDFTKRTDWTNIQTIKESFMSFLDELGKPWEGADKTFEEINIDELGTRKNCPTGTCPTTFFYQ